MEDLPGSDSLGSLADYLRSGFTALEEDPAAYTFNLADPLAGLTNSPDTLTRFDVKLEVQQPEELPSTSGHDTTGGQQGTAYGLWSTEQDGDQDQDDAVTDGQGEAPGKGGKRRRRNRTERQQVLNRLAQQRYRQRKKEKVQQLQSSVCTLQTQLDRLSFLETENAALRATASSLGSELAAKDAALKTTSEQLRQTAVLFKQSVERCSAAERSLTEAQQTVEAQRQQLRSSTLLGMDPQALADRLMGIIKQALVEAAEAEAQQQPAAMALLGNEALVAAIGRSLTSACRRELVYAGKGAQVVAEAPSSIPVSCC